MTAARIQDITPALSRIASDFVAVDQKADEADAKATGADEKAVAAQQTADAVEIVTGQTPEKSGAVGEGADDTAALRAWAAQGGRKAARQGTQYRMATWAGTTTFAAGSRSSLKGSTILQGFGLASNNQVAEVGAGADVSGLSWAVDGAIYFRRGFRLNSGSSVRDFKIQSPTPSPSAGGYDARSHVLYVAGPDVRIEDGLIEGFHQQNINAVPDDATLARAVIRNVEFRGYAAGAKVNNLPGSLVDGLYARGIGPEATTSPGQNILTGGSAHSVYQNIHQLGDGSGSGEHFLYSDAGDGTQGIRVLGVTNWASGQCFIKLRGHDGFVVSDCHGGGIGLGNAPGTNEDVLRLEYCRNGVVSNLSMRKTVARGGFDGLHINNCWNLRYSNISLDGCERASVFICTSASSTYTLPPAGGVDNIRINGIIAEQFDTRPFLLFGLDDSASTSTCTVGNLTITGIQWAGTKAQLHAVAAGATLARLPGTHIHMSGRARDGMFTFDWPAANPTPTIT